MHLVFKPPPDVGVLSSFRKLRRQIGKHLKNEVPLSLIVRQLDVVGQCDARNAGVNERERLEIVFEEKRPAVGDPGAKIVRDHSLVYGDVAVTIAADLLIRDSERRCAAVLLRLSGRRSADPEDPEPAEASITQADLAGAANLSLSSVKSMLGRLRVRRTRLAVVGRTAGMGGERALP